MDYIRDFQMDGGKADRFTLLGALVASIGWFVPIGCSQDVDRPNFFLPFAGYLYASLNSFSLFSWSPLCPLGK